MATKAMRPTATHWREVRVAKMTGRMTRQQMSSVVLRARLIVQPRLMKAEDIQPPATLPMSAKR